MELKIRMAPIFLACAVLASAPVLRAGEGTSPPTEAVKPDPAARVSTEEGKDKSLSAIGTSSGDAAVEGDQEEEQSGPTMGAVVGGIVGGVLYVVTVPAQVVLFFLGPLGWAASLVLLAIPATVGWMVGSKVANKRVPILYGVILPWIAELGGALLSVVLSVACSPLSVIPYVGGILYMAVVLGTPAVALGASTGYALVKAGRYRTADETSWFYRDLTTVPEPGAASAEGTPEKQPATDVTPAPKEGGAVPSP